LSRPFFPDIDRLHIFLENSEFPPTTPDARTIAETSMPSDRSESLFGLVAGSVTTVTAVSNALADSDPSELFPSADPDDTDAAGTGFFLPLKARRRLRRRGGKFARYFLALKEGFLGATGMSALLVARDRDVLADVMSVTSMDVRSISSNP
jgi:hypothetical protein